MKVLRFTLLSLCYFVGQMAHAYISLQLTPVNSPSFCSKQGIQSTITSNLDYTISMVAEVTIRTSKGMTVCQYTTEAFDVNQGVNLLNENNTAIRGIKYGNTDYANYENTNGYLPQGAYSICVRLRCVSEVCFKALSDINSNQLQKCQTKASINPTPLLLSLPRDNAEIDEVRPNFTWIPPMPVGSDPSLTYTYVLVELRERQRGEAAIRRNRPLHIQENIKGVMLPFPAELDDLERGKRYAWQVTSVLGSTPIQQSEVWEFEIKKEEEVIIAMPFVRLKTTDTRVYNAVNELKVVYNERANKEQLNYTIQSNSGQRMSSNTEIPVPIQFGENSIRIDLKGLGLEHKDYYVLNVRGSDGLLYQLKFRYYFSPVSK
jgi:hypothetical protein